MNMPDGNESHGEHDDSSEQQPEPNADGWVHPELIEALSKSPIVEFTIPILKETPGISIGELQAKCRHGGFTLSKSYGYNLKSTVRRALGLDVDTKYHNTGMREFIRNFPSDASATEIVKQAAEAGIRTSPYTYQMVSHMQRARRKEESEAAVKEQGAAAAERLSQPQSRLDDVRAWEEMMPKPAAPVAFDREPDDEEPPPAAARGPKPRVKRAPPLPPAPLDSAGASIRDGQYPRDVSGRIEYGGSWIPPERRGKRGPIAASDKPQIYGRVELRRLMMRMGLHVAREVLEELETEAGMD